jgi:acetolactate synthase-1/2/3 large subunit
MKVSEYLTNFLKEKAIDTVFVLQGGMITNLIDAIYKDGGIKIVSMHHEQAAAFAADAWARATNRCACAMATSGAGAVNLLSGVGSCYFDGVPCIFITGQVNSHERKTIGRQIGFQEMDIAKMAEPITKAVYEVKSAKDFPFILGAAYEVAMTPRYGSVLIDIPIDFQYESIY